VIWLTWRQFRAQTIAASAALAVLAVILAVTGPHLAGLYDNSGIPACHAHGDCGTVIKSFASQLKADSGYQLLFYVGIGVMFAVPALIGVFWGAPLVTREIEAGTFALAWSQSVTRTRWLAVKLGLIGLAAMATAGLFSLMVTWWASPVDRVAAISGSHESISFSRLDPLVFAARGVTPIGYAAFAFALGVAAGVLIRRTLPAMAVTLAVFAAVQIAMPNWVRPHLIAPVRTISALNPANLAGLGFSNNNTMTVIAGVNKPGAWILSNQTITPAGQVFTGPPTPACLSRTSSFQACQNSLPVLHLRQLLTYQPASRYWAFQWYETAIFLALALILTGLCYWWIRRRRLS
jgi:ABC-type transport system involved in multi-copper enzyme maturation permease subunit